MILSILPSCENLKWLIDCDYENKISTTVTDNLNLLTLENKIKQHTPLLRLIQMGGVYSFANNKARSTHTLQESSVEL